LVLPLSLKLRNFLSYREDVPTLHLEEVHLACLCGANGHGKSALLDAITWALWGKARGQRQEQLLHQGQQEMTVELEFQVHDQRYRTVRRYAHTRRGGTSSLELAVAAGEGYQAITGNTITATQTQLQQLINMDYDTFVNSAFLLQGRADLFSMSAPAQRKEVLAKVLGLGLYDRLEDRAKAGAKSAQAHLEATGRVMEQLEERVARRAALTKELAQTSTDMAIAQQAVSSREERRKLLADHIGHLNQRGREAAALEEQAQRIRARRQSAEFEAAQIQARLNAWRDELKDWQETEHHFQELTETRQSLILLQTAAGYVHALERDLAPLAQQAALARASLESKIAVQLWHLNQELVPRAKALPALEKALTQSTVSLAALEPQMAELAALIERQQQTSLEARRLESENTRLGDVGRDTRKKLDLLDHDHVQGAICPVCGTAMDAGAISRLEQTYQQEIDTQRTRYRDQEERIKLLDHEAAQLQSQTSGRQHELDATRQGLALERAQMKAQRQESQQAHEQLEQARSVLAEDQEALDQGRYAQEEQAQVVALQHRIEQAHFSPESLAKAQTAVRNLELWEEKHRQLEEARSRVPDDEVALASVQARIVEGGDELAEMANRRDQLESALAELDDYRTQMTTVEAEHQEATLRHGRLHEQWGSLQHQVQEADEAQRELKQRRREHQTLAQQAATFAELAQAFGKGGVQALLIEAAIPRLEEEANLLLHRMTDGRMSLKMETQRARRSGPGRNGAEAVETLEIQVADELGTRAYEMFSGGESFRVDFALRVALSKLLAWRVGAPLPTLFIDEGFGTQDVEGRDRILDVIKSIEPDFQRILVVTHIDEVKEAFPVRIEVTRTSAGSTFSLS
jgi:exonuclease SbcC